jgi:uncharacterized protein YndB with AHSA1/START domain
MNTHCGLKIEPKGDLEIVLTRGFAADRALVFSANTEPELLKRWLGVRKGWILAVCEVDLQVGGRYRYVWRNEAKGKELASGGVFLEIVRPERLVCTEQFDDPWYDDECVVTTEFAPVEAGTLMTMTMRWKSKQTRNTVLQSGMATGMEESYVQLEAVLAGGI